MKVNLEYERLVERGSEIVSNMKTAKYDLCELALKVCRIQVGGHVTDKPYYSIKRYAEDIGMNYKSLAKWLEEHRNVVKKLPIKPKAEDYKVIRQVMKRVNSKNTIAEVREVYNKYKDYSQEDLLLLSNIKYAKTIRNFLQDNKLGLLQEEDLNVLINVIKEINQVIKEQL